MPSELVSDVVIRLRTGRRTNVLAYADLTVGGAFRIRGVKVVQRPKDEQVRVFFPFRPVSARCDNCRRFTANTDRYCHSCGTKQPWRDFGAPTPGKEPVMREEVVHPLGHTRKAVEFAVLQAYMAAAGIRPRLFVPPAMAGAV
jgi:DNA-binding cell septation regulator SpoVG